MKDPSRDLGAPEQDHLLFAPAWAEHHVADLYRPHLTLAESMLREGSDLLMRCHSSASNLGSEVVVTVLFRQVLAMADAVFVLLAKGATQAAEGNLRHLLEARWGLKYALRDPQKWGVYVHVRTIRANREEQRRFVEGTPEWAKHEAARELVRKSHPRFDELVMHYRASVAAADAILAQEPLRTVDEAFVAARGDRDHEPAWYCDGSIASPKQRISSISKLAAAVGCQAEYETAYKYGSYAVHGGHESSHLTHHSVGTAIALFRTPEGFRSPFIFASSQLIECMLEMLKVFREGELRSFFPRVQDWQQTIMATPELSLTLRR